MNHRASRQQGFTIVELMIATLVFSVILIVITSGVTHFTTSYYKGIHVSATQTTTRDVINLIKQQLQYGGGAVNNTLSQGNNGPDNWLCVGTLQIDYKLGAQLGQPAANVYGVFVSSKPSNTACTAYNPLSPPANGSELLAPNMRLTELTVTSISGASVGTAHNLYSISAGVAYGDTDLLCSQAVAPNLAGGCDTAAPIINFDNNAWIANGAKVVCKTGAGSQFCAFSHLTTEVVARY